MDNEIKRLFTIIGIVLAISIILGFAKCHDIEQQQQKYQDITNQLEQCRKEKNEILTRTRSFNNNQQTTR